MPEQKKPAHDHACPAHGIAQDITALIGHTPMLRLNRIMTSPGCRAEIVMKLEYFNPASSVKDRLAKALVEDAEACGLLKPHQTPPQILVESTSGNTGIGLALMAIAHGYRLILTMPSNMSEERKNLLLGLGAELVLTPPAQGMDGAQKEAERIRDATPGAVIMGQFSNPANMRAHYETTGPEIWRSCGGKLDIFVSAVGTGGTLSGVARYLREQNPQIKIYAVEPAESPLLSLGRAAPHLIQGIGTNFVPPVLDRKCYDAILAVPGEEALKMARRLILEEGVLCGISSGAGAYAAVELARREENAGKRIACIACDTAERYLSTRLFTD